MKVKTSLWKKTDHLAVAVSTGIDSMCLLYKLLNDLSHSYQSITCLHVNHGLRDASVEEERFIKQFCKQYQIPCYVKQLDLSETVEKGKSTAQIRTTLDTFELVAKHALSELLLI